MFSTITVQRKKSLSVVSDLAWGRHTECDRAGQRGTEREDRKCQAKRHCVTSVVMASVSLTVAEEGGRGVRCREEPWW